MSDICIGTLIVITLVITIVFNLIAEVNKPKKIKGDSKK